MDKNYASRLVVAGLTCSRALLRARLAGIFTRVAQLLVRPRSPLSSSCGVAPPAHPELGLGLVGVLLFGGLAIAGGGPAVVEPQLLEFTGPLNDRRAEVSGLDWSEEWLAILPQDPLLFGHDGMLGFFGIPRQDLLDAVEGRRTEPLHPVRHDCEAAGLVRVIAGFDGVEAIGLAGDRAYMTVEAKEDTVMAGYLLCGRAHDVEGRSVVDMTRLTSIPLGCNIPNIAEESLVVDGERVITISEANGANCVPHPLAKVFDAELQYVGAIPFPVIEYRVTDATALDAEGRFWVINYFWPPEKGKLRPAEDPEIARHGRPEGYDPDGCVERLLELQLLPDDRIVRTDTPPIYLKTVPGKDCRNWEALARLDDLGFLLMTDKYPGTLLAFVPQPYH